MLLDREQEAIAATGHENLSQSAVSVQQAGKCNLAPVSVDRIAKVVDGPL